MLGIIAHATRAHRFFACLVAGTLVSLGVIPYSYAADLRFTFTGVWENVNPYDPPVDDPLTALIGTPFSGIVQFPTVGTDLDPEPFHGHYEFAAEEITFSVDSEGDAFDVVHTAPLVVQVWNDATDGQVTGGYLDLPYWDILYVYIPLGKFIIELYASTSGGDPPTAFSSDAIPSPAEIVNTYDIRATLWAPGFTGDEIFLAAFNPFGPPPHSFPDTLDVDIAVVTAPGPVAVPLPVWAIVALTVLLPAFGTRVRKANGTVALAIIRVSILRRTSGRWPTAA